MKKPSRPSCKTTAPPPKTVSAAAQRALSGPSTEAGPADLQMHREMCARVQQELGATMLQRHRVKIQDSFVAGVPVRIFTVTGTK